MSYDTMKDFYTDLIISHRKDCEARSNTFQTAEVQRLKSELAVCKAELNGYKATHEQLMRDHANVNQALEDTSQLLLKKCEELIERDSEIEALQARMEEVRDIGLRFSLRVLQQIDRIRELEVQIADLLAKNEQLMSGQAELDY